jgi:hypothetical protein
MKSVPLEESSWNLVITVITSTETRSRTKRIPYLVTESSPLRPFVYDVILHDKAATLGKQGKVNRMSKIA